MENKWYKAIERSQAPAAPTEPQLNLSALVGNITSKRGDDRAAALAEAVTLLESSPKQRYLVRFGYGFHTLSQSERDQLRGRVAKPTETPTTPDVAPPPVEVPQG